MKENSLSKFISLILRHKPEIINIAIDNQGWANVDELINGINKSGRKIDKKILEEIVRADNKQRCSFNEDKTLIRANQGHSISVDVGLKECEPPEFLYHGTAEKYIDSILQNGILSKTRLYVHLSKDIETAINVGLRHGKPVILKIESKKMYNENIKFFLSENGVWLTDFVDKKYFSILKEADIR